MPMLMLVTLPRKVDIIHSTFCFRYKGLDGQVHVFTQ